MSVEINTEWNGYNVSVDIENCQQVFGEDEQCLVGTVRFEWNSEHKFTDKLWYVVAEFVADNEDAILEELVDDAEFIIKLRDKFNKQCEADHWENCKSRYTEKFFGER